MIKRITLLAGMALAAVAVMAPAAQANVTLSDAKGTLKAGALVTATSTNLVTTRHNKTKLECQKVTLHLEVTNAGKTHVVLKQLGEATTLNCILNRSEAEMPNLPVTIDDGTLGFGEGNSLTINTWGTGNTNASFRSTIFADASHTLPPVADCTFTGNVHVQAGTVPTDEIAVAGTLKGPCGDGTMHGNFTLETTSGEQVFINHKVT